MPTIHMTKSAVKALKAASKDTVYWDAGLPGFGVKVTPRSRKVFVVLYRIGGATITAQEVHDQVPMGV